MSKKFWRGIFFSTIFSLILWALLFLFIRAVFAQEYPERVPRLAIQEEYEMIQTPEQLGDFMADNFTYDLERWSVRDASPVMTTEQMLRIRKGVCRDFAHFAGEWLDAHGYEPQQIAMRSGLLGHVIVYYQAGDMYCGYNSMYRYCSYTVDGLVRGIGGFNASCWYVREWDSSDLVRC